MLSAVEIVEKTDRLPSLPAAYLKVKRVIDDPHGSIRQLAAAMSSDPAMAARVLRVVNSPFYGYPGRIETVTRALNILGMQQVHDVVLAWAISSAFADVRTAVIPMKSFWRQSVARAIAARQLARRAGFVDAERLFVEGLLSDIGHLVMYTVVPDLAIAAMTGSRQTERPLHEVELELIGCDYAEVGAALVLAWELPESFYEPIKCQLAPSAATIHRLEAAILHIAGTLGASATKSPSVQPDPDALSVLELDEASLISLYNEVTGELDSAFATFFPNLAAA
ncbi:HDOD domain-containing protein [Accumulibacter sp.]|uniref:HDOD domain-containing protein n=1 Tax=Accumulibacter sp. TaxID=2053492 RepID=UPI0035B28AB4